MPCRKQAHSSTKSAAEYWVPASAGMTGERVAMHRASDRKVRSGFRTNLMLKQRDRAAPRFQFTVHDSAFDWFVRAFQGALAEHRGSLFRHPRASGDPVNAGI